MVLPNTSLEAMELSPRERLKQVMPPVMAQPAVVPVRKSGTRAMPTMESACRRLPRNQMVLRMGRPRTAAAMKSWGSREPDSRRGTRSPAKKPGAPSVLSSQTRVVLGLRMRSPTWVRALAKKMRRKFPGTSLQASSEMALQTRSSSSARNS